MRGVFFHTRGNGAGREKNVGKERIERGFYREREDKNVSFRLS